MMQETGYINSASLNGSFTDARDVTLLKCTSSWWKTLLLWRRAINSYVVLVTKEVDLVEQFIIRSISCEFSSIFSSKIIHEVTWFFLWMKNVSVWVILLSSLQDSFWVWEIFHLYVVSSSIPCFPWDLFIFQNQTSFFPSSGKQKFENHIYISAITVVLICG